MEKVKQQPTNWLDTPEMTMEEYLKFVGEFGDQGLGIPIISTGKPTDGKLTIKAKTKNINHGKGTSN